MRILYFFTLFLVTSLAFSQEVQKIEITIGKVNRTFHLMLPDPPTEKTYLIFGDHANASLDPEAMLMSLSKFSADHRVALLASGMPSHSYSIEEWNHALMALFPEFKLADSRFISFGKGIELTKPLLESGMSGIIVSPTDSLDIDSISQSATYAIINVLDEDESNQVHAFLAKAGAWVNTEMAIGESPFHFDHRDELLSKAQIHMDSLQLVLDQDSLIRTKKSGLVKGVPEILHQGRPLTVLLQVYQPGQFKISIEALNGECLRMSETFAGKGRLQTTLKTSELDWGVYKLVIDGPGILEKHKFMIRG